MLEQDLRWSLRSRIALGVAVLAPFLSLVGLHPPGRPALALAFFLLVPGVAFAELLRLPSALASWSLAISLSLTVNMLAAQTALLFGFWAPLAGQIALAVISIVCLVVARRLDLRKVGTDRPDVAHAADDAHVDEPEQGRRPHRMPTDRITFGVLGLAVVSFVVALHTTDQDAMNGFGLISALGWPFFLALVLVCFAFTREFSRTTLRDSHLAAATIVLVFILFGIQNGSDSAAGFPVAWLHVGFTDYVGTNGVSLPSFDARFSWPGFFAGAATLVSLAGTRDASDLLRWAPVAYNLLALIPLVLLARKVTSRPHIAWLGVVIYYCANWYEQDYFSPQATNLIVYLSVLAILYWLGHDAAPGTDLGVVRRIRNWWVDGVLRSTGRLVTVVLHGRPPRAPGVSAAQYVALELAFVVMIVGVVVSHQLTPIALILALAAFSITGRTRYKGLWLIMGLVFIGYFSYGGTVYWVGHITTVLGDVGQVGSTVQTGVSARVSGDPAHLHVQFLRLATSAALAGMAALGLVLRRKSPWLPLMAALAFSPFLILGLQSYGGEVVIRCFLFATPFLALLAAELAAPVFKLPRAWGAVVLMVLLLMGTMLQVVTRGANQPFVRVTADQVNAVRTIEARASADASVGFFNDFQPIQLIPPLSVTLDNITACPDTTSIAACTSETKPDFIYASAGQEEYGVLIQGEETGWLDLAVEQILATGEYVTIIDEPSVTVLERKPGLSTDEGTS